MQEAQSPYFEIPFTLPLKEFCSDFSIKYVATLLTNAATALFFILFCGKKRFLGFNSCRNKIVTYS